MKQPQHFQKPMLLVLFFFAATFCFAQVTEAWVKRYNDPGNENDQATKIVVDACGNVYVAGSTATIKYDAAGNELWIRSGATSLALDTSGNVYVTAGGVSTKYDTDGAELWVRTHDININSMTVDASGNMYVTGWSSGSGTGTDYATIKYDAAGTELWVKRYNGLADGGDYARSLVVDASGNVYVTGSSWGGEDTFTDYATIKYNAGGAELWVKRFDNYNNYYDRAIALAVDGVGNVYVTGSSTTLFDEEQYATVKYDASGTERWVRYLDGVGDPELSDVNIPTSLAVDSSGNVYVTGRSTGYSNDYDCVTIKYDTAGAVLWQQRYTGPEGFSDVANALALDAAGNVYITGSSENNGFSGSDARPADFLTVKYNTAGTKLWERHYNGLGDSTDVATSLAVDTSGNVYVAGWSSSAGTGTDYTTIKYAQIKPLFVSYFTLIGADTLYSQYDLTELKNGDTINLAAYGLRILNIRANTSPATVGSVVFNLRGAETRNHTENIWPYALFADNNKGHYYGWKPTNGNYTLTATAYSGTKGCGQKGGALTVHFYVIYQTLDSFTLVNAETGQDIKTLIEGEMLNLTTLPAKLNIRANTTPATVGSVQFHLNGPESRTHTENIVPYALFADDTRGHYHAWTPKEGYYTLSATPYERRNAHGNFGAYRYINFSAFRLTTVQTQTANSRQTSIAVAQESAEDLKAAPNPFTGQTTIRFSVPESGYTTVQVYDIKGMVVKHLYQAWATGRKEYSVPFNGKLLPGGVYVVRLATGKQVQSYKLVLIR